MATPEFPQTKISQLRALMQQENWRDALKMAASFQRLGAEKVAILRGWEACARPDFQRQLGRCPDSLIAAGVAALRKKYRKDDRG